MKVSVKDKKFLILMTVVESVLFACVVVFSFVALELMPTILNYRSTGVWKGAGLPLAVFAWVIFAVLLSVDIPLFYNSKKSTKGMVGKGVYLFFKLLIATVVVVASFVIYDV
ncbi:MAG: hypothetical protein FWD76_05530 [Firmicutes bacterium]|nr:hypothetical protein [Bacillota bacterium]